MSLNGYTMIFSKYTMRLFEHKTALFTEEKKKQELYIVFFRLSLELFSVLNLGFQLAFSLRYIQTE
jgi:hypothetical protein